VSEPFDPKILESDEAIAWLAGALAGWFLPKPWKVDDEDGQIAQNRSDLREAIEHAIANPEWVERSQ
jgi:hypothetical protein